MIKSQMRLSIDIKSPTHTKLGSVATSVSGPIHKVRRVIAPNQDGRLFWHGRQAAIVRGIVGTGMTQSQTLWNLDT